MPMTPPATCLRCGSDAIIPDVRPDAHDQHDSSRAQYLIVARKPDAIVFKENARVATTASVCADCGFVEVYAVDPEALWAAHLDRVANGWTA